MKKNDLKRQVAAAMSACREKKAEEITVLELEKGSGAFTDYFVVHVFSEKARRYYDLERLWKSARRMEPTQLESSRAGKRSPRRKKA